VIAHQRQGFGCGRSRTGRAAGQLFRRKSLGDEQGNVLAVFLDCLLKATRDFLDRNGVNLDEINLFVPSQHSAEFVADLTAGMSIDAQRVVNLVNQGEDNPSSSLFPLALSEGRRSGRFERGDLVLAAIVCPGVQVGCALYRA